MTDFQKAFIEKKIQFDSDYTLESDTIRYLTRMFEDAKTLFSECGIIYDNCKESEKTFKNYLDRYSLSEYMTGTTCDLDDEYMDDILESVCDYQNIYNEATPETRKGILKNHILNQMLDFEKWEREYEETKTDVSCSTPVNLNYADFADNTDAFYDQFRSDK